MLGACGKAPAFNRALAAAEGVVRGRDRVEASGLSFSGSGFKAQVFWAHGPLVDELCSFVLAFTGPEGTLADPPYEVRIAPEMPDMGHGTSPVEIVRLGAGLWKVQEVFFSMPGRWVVPINFFKNGQLASSASFEVRL